MKILLTILTFITITAHSTPLTTTFGSMKQCGVGICETTVFNLIGKDKSGTSARVYREELKIEMPKILLRKGMTPTHISIICDNETIMLKENDLCRISIFSKQ